MECATLFIVGFARKVPVGALMLISDLPLRPDGIKTAESAKAIFDNYTGKHLELGVEALLAMQKKEAGGFKFSF
jgi:AMP nucleosidase